MTTSPITGPAGLAWEPAESCSRLPLAVVLCGLMRGSPDGVGHSLSGPHGQPRSCAAYEGEGHILDRSREVKKVHWRP